MGADHAARSAGFSGSGPWGQSLGETGQDARASRQRRPRIGEILETNGLVSAADVEAALSAQRQVGGLIGQTLVRLGSVSETDLLRALSVQLDIPVVTATDLPGVDEVRAAADRVHASLGWLVEHEAIIWFVRDAEQERLAVASRNPIHSALQDAAEQWHREPALLYLAGTQDLELLLDRLDKDHAAAAALASDADSELVRLRELAEEAPVIDFVNAMFSDALLRRASDVHIEPFEDRFVVRFRIDGILHQWRAAPRSSFEAVASRLKLLSGMDIAERRLPQDGRQTVRIAGREVDLRVSSFPAIWGESLVMRLLGKTRSLPELEALGVANDHRRLLTDLVSKPNGVLLVTGPTGSGKTTTIYRLLMQLNDGVKKIITVEDPVEFELSGIVQMQVRADIGLNFATGLRSILRQDPDVILVGEIRDSETARIAVQAALTGHLVVSTLHTNSGLAAVPRLLDLGIEEFILGDVLRGVVSQRLVRRLCERCARPAPAAVFAQAERVLADAGLLPVAAPVYREPVGCPSCAGAGFHGRIGLYEVAAIDAAMNEIIRRRGSEAELMQAARPQGFRTLPEDGLIKARLGLTTLSEVARVATPD